eukprot:Rhum_TRINITY_DN65_c0_g1::Rhum_TRINITY_DN65_c0_g1_i1::g.175::m.175
MCGCAAMSQAWLDWGTAFVDRWAAREGDTPAERLTKRLLTLCYLSLTAPFAIVFYSATNRESRIGQGVSIVVPVLMLVLLAYLRIARHASTRFVTVSSVMAAAAIVIVDLVHSAEVHYVIWPAAVVLLDVALVAQVDESGTMCIVVFMCSYLTLASAEQWLRFGLYDLPGLAPYEKRFCQGDCEKPPCPRAAYSSIGMLTTNVLIFLFNFYFTRGFALQVRREKEKIAAAVAATEQV